MDDEGKVSEAAIASDSVNAETMSEAASAASAASIDPGPSVSDTPAVEKAEAKKKRPKKQKKANQLRKFREDRCLSQAELARRANLSALTIARIEKGFGCRMSTKRKILEALGLSLADRVRVFGEEE